MPSPTFARLSLEQFAALLDSFPFTRRINAVHMHHTWRPRQADFRGHETIVAMWHHHTQVNGWSDIAQHLTIDPQGFVWLGRNWNLPPASASGNNGNKAVGPFMFEMVGDFDRGREPFEGPQREAALRVIALVQRRFGLAASSLRFHNMMSPKSCPGDAIDYDETLAEVTRLRATLDADLEREGASRAVPFPDEAHEFLRRMIRELGRVTDNTGEPGDAEPAEALQGPRAGDGGDGIAREPALDPQSLARLRPHLVNLRAGRFSNEGEFTSTAPDVDAIFEQHLPAEIAALPPGGRLRLLLFAHGGLVSERSGLAIAQRHVDWWMRNGVYPLYFIWETGFFETLSQLLERARQGTRGLTRDLADFTTDPLIEIAARVLQGPRIWGGMKWSAQRAAEPEGPDGEAGGAFYVARRLKDLCDRHGDRLELHAAGHSAGSILLAHLLPQAQALGVPPWRTLHFMAPALRVDAFRQQMLPGLRNGSLAGSLTLYTLRRDYERADNCAQVYRKSLLYLVHNALEDALRTPLLGLEDSLRQDAQLKAFFALDGSPPQRGDVVWSVSASGSGRSASAAVHHGDFDDDPLTMNSIVRRVLDRQDADDIVPYDAGGGRAREWADEVDWPADFGAAPPPAMPIPAPISALVSAQAPASTSASLSVPGPVPASMPQPSPVAVPAAVPLSSPGRRLALCVGIDAYPNPEHRLSGCVNDARAWASALAGLGFEVHTLFDGQATRAALAEQLQRLVTHSRAGDVLAFQYSGHGTRVTDLDGDETDGWDEALCPVDFYSGALFIDDDIARVLAQLPDAVDLTIFMDCCHSGTNTRFAVGLTPGATDLPPGSKARFVVATPQLLQAHRQFRQRLRGALPGASTGGREQMRHVKFSACLDDQVALESGGNGEFTRRATRVLARGIGGMSNERFLRAVLAEFGAAARQKPMLDCATPARALALLAPWSSPAPTASP